MQDAQGHRRRDPGTKAEGCDILMMPAHRRSSTDTGTTWCSAARGSAARSRHSEGRSIRQPLTHGELRRQAVLACRAAPSPQYNGFRKWLERWPPGMTVGRAEIVRMGAGAFCDEIPSAPQQGARTTRRKAEGPQQRRASPCCCWAAGRSTRWVARTRCWRMPMPAVGRPCREGRTRIAGGRGGRRVATWWTTSAPHSRRACGPSRACASSNRISPRPQPPPVPAPASAASAQCRRGHSCRWATARVNAGCSTLMAAYNPRRGPAICVPTVGGKRGNNVLWARRFFPEMSSSAGDTGAKHLIGEHGRQVSKSR